MTLVRNGHHALFLALALGGTTLDLGSKWLAFTFVGTPPDPQVLRPNPKLVVWKDVFSITTSFNRGALWGFLDKKPYANAVFAVLSLVAAAAILTWLFVVGAVRDRMLALALGFIMAGTLGNCYDRVVWGKVRDFLYFELINWPIFNLADSCLVCGAFILMVQAFFSEIIATEPQATAAAASAVQPTAEVSDR